nr:RING-H2 finger protein ATL22-like isoform X1 [Setaria viridis]
MHSPPGLSLLSRFTSRAMAPLLPLLLLLPILLLLAIADALPPACSEVVTCAGQVVRYPFSLNSSESDCGYPGLDLFCEDNATLILPVKSHRYRVVGIDYQAHTVAVSDDDISKYANTGGCLRLHVNLTIDYTNSWLQLTQSDSNVTFLYNCKKSISWFPAVELRGCQQQDGKKSYMLPDGGITGTEAYEHECEEVVVAPVLGLHKEEILPLTNGSFEVVKAGFELMYNAHSQQCDGCERSGGWCGYQRNDTHGGMNFTCFCDNGPAAARCSQWVCHMIAYNREHLVVVAQLDFGPSRPLVDAAGTDRLVPNIGLKQKPGFSEPIYVKI